jgi:hypothetical protein
MLDDPTPLDSYRLQWNPRFFGDLIVALSLGDARQHLPFAITKLSNPLRQRLSVACGANARAKATVLDLLRKLNRS